MKLLSSTPYTGDRLPGWVGMGVLALFTLSTILGYWVFALHPNLIPETDFARRVYALSYAWFARLHIVVAGAVLAFHLFRTTDTKWVLGFFAVVLVSFLSEHIGTGYGFPFGGYEYTHLLGYKVGGRVPFLIPISWFLMALPSWVLANVIFSGREKRILRLILAAYLLTAWDLALDPAMSFLTPYWVWETPGPFYGMPWVNLAGWMGTGLVLMGVLEAVGVAQWSSTLSIRWIMAYYGLVLLMPVGMLAAAGIWGPIVATSMALLLPWCAFVFGKRVRRPKGVVGLMKEQAGK